jgi:hypothetical protein
VPLEVRVEHGAAQLQLSHRTLDFPDRARDVARIESRAGRKARRMPAAGICGDVIGLPRQGGPLARPHHLHAGRSQQQQLPVDPVLVHVRESRRPEVLQHPLQVRIGSKHAAHLQGRVVGRVAALQVLDLCLHQPGESPRLLGCDPLVWHGPVDFACRRRKADPPARHPLDVVAAQSLLAAVRQQLARHRFPLVAPRG